ncbi:MAG: hypothetical protein A3F67_05490 [Verrucomicrobia bacterium RIFCSPHIGHO2_12_FULL_41_10]|nr:MAG: hypothetical protein A3F67_05490 [Verrucomicrobia bacterium RIFCSPHIGHO2_12_FULL_41_10]
MNFASFLSGLLTYTLELDPTSVQGRSLIATKEHKKHKRRSKGRRIKSKFWDYTKPSIYKDFHHFVLEQGVLITCFQSR